MVPPETVQLAEYDAPVFTGVGAVQLTDRVAATTVMEIVCEALVLAGDALSVTVTVKLYDAGGGEGTVPVNVMLLPVDPLGVSHAGKVAKLQVNGAVPFAAVQVAE